MDGDILQLGGSDKGISDTAEGRDSSVLADTNFSGPPSCARDAEPVMRSRKVMIE